MVGGVRFFFLYTFFFTLYACKLKNFLTLFFTLITLLYYFTYYVIFQYSKSQKGRGELFFEPCAGTHKIKHLPIMPIMLGLGSTHNDQRRGVAEIRSIHFFKYISIWSYDLCIVYDYYYISTSQCTLTYSQ